MYFVNHCLVFLRKGEGMILLLLAFLGLFMNAEPNFLSVYYSSILIRLFLLLAA